MASFLQGEIKIIHTVEGQTPTETIKPTDANEDIEDALETLDEDKVDLKGLRRRGGRVSIQRRLANYAMQNAERLMNIGFDNAIHKQVIFGDSRSVKKIENTKATMNLITNNVKASVGATITSYAVGNFAILGLQAINLGLGALNTAAQNLQSARQFTEKSNIEFFESNRRRERLNVGTYNRR